MHWRAADLTAGVIQRVRRSRCHLLVNLVAVLHAMHRARQAHSESPARRPLPAVLTVLLVTVLGWLPGSVVGSAAAAQPLEPSKRLVADADKHPAAASPRATRGTATGNTPAVESHAAQATGKTVRTTIDNVTPTAGNDTGTVRASGRITNTGQQNLYEVNAAFWISHEPLRNRSQIADAARERPGERSGTRLADPEYSYDLLDQVTEKLQPGETERFTLKIPVDQLELTTPGNYLVGADVRATPPQQTRQTVSQARTFLPWVPRQQQTSPVEVGVVVPLTAEPAAVNGDTVLDAQSLRRFAPDGRLSRLLELGDAHEVTWLLDPNLITDAKTIADGADTQTGSTSPAERKRAAKHAQKWLNRVSDVLNDGNTLLLPYADPDIPELHRHGLPDHLEAAVDNSASVAERTDLSPTLDHDASESGGAEPTTPEPTDAEPSTPGSAGSPESSESQKPKGDGGNGGDGEDGGADATTEAGQAGPAAKAPQAEPSNGPQSPSPSRSPGSEQDLQVPNADDLPRPESSRVIGWPGTGHADDKLLTSMAEHDISAAILSDEALPGLNRDGTAPLASVATADGAISTLVNDTALTAGGPGGGRTELLTRQRMLADTTDLSLLPTRDGNQPRRVTMVLPRDFHPGASGASLLDSIERTPWLRSTSPLSWLSDSAPQAYGGPLTSPEGGRGTHLSRKRASDLAAYDKLSTNYESMLAEPEQTSGRLEREFLRGASTSWRGANDRGRRMLSTFQERIDTAMHKVKVLDPRFVTLSSRSGRFPVSVWNTSNQPVRVIVEAKPRVQGALQTDPQEPITIQPHRKSTVQVDAKSATGGAVQVQVSLTTPNGARFGNSESFAVRSTDYGLVGWVVIGVGLVALFVMVALRIIRRIRASRRSGTAERNATPGSSASADDSDTTGTARVAASSDAEQSREHSDDLEAEPRSARPPSSS